jgi:lipid II isoglutaminyl synthase (glutamine-hydrolysing)
MYLISITLAKLLNLIITTLNLGAGYTLPGHIALSIYPGLLKHPYLFPQKGLIYVSATNGKTTTTKLITHIFKKNGRSVVTNISGANLLNGIASALALDTSFFGKCRADYGVFEVDEFALPLLLKQKVPDVLVLLNLSRDQLDRYGEIDTILDKWALSINELPKTTTLVLDGTQENLSKLAVDFKGAVVYFDDVSREIANKKLSGVFNTKNLNAAVHASVLLGISLQKSLEAVEDFVFAWGRGEQFNKYGIDWRIMLAKNPASFNSNLAEIIADSDSLSEFTTLLFILNDNIPDGRDVSWIYDIAPEKLVQACGHKQIYVSGKRAYDMAVRLMYAGVEVSAQQVHPSLQTLVATLKTELRAGAKVLVLPNYSAMLHFRKIVLGRNIL